MLRPSSNDDLPSGRQPWFRNRPPLGEGSELGTSLVAILVGGFMAVNVFLRPPTQVSVIAFPLGCALFLVGVFGLLGVYRRWRISAYEDYLDRR